MSSFPSNPLCWVFATVEANESEDRYTLRRGLISISPDWMPMAACPASIARDVIGPAPTPVIGVAQEGQFSLSKLRERWQTDCHFQAWMRFARAPWLTESEATDVRFASGLRGNFTTIRFEELRDEACSAYVPQWGFPRRDLLMPSSEKLK